MSKMVPIEFAQNPENRCPVVILADTSGSMVGEKINQLNEGLRLFQEETSADAQASVSVEIAIIEFGYTINKVVDFCTVDDFTPPTLEANGRTPLGEAILKAINVLEERKQLYKDNQIGYYRPWLIIITDGHPTDEWEYAASILKEEESASKLTSYVIGVGEGVDYQILSALTNGDVYKLKGVNFKDLFSWLSASVKQVSVSAIGEAIVVPAVKWGEVQN